MKRHFADFKSLKYQLWLYFAVFAAFIMVILWLLQIILLNTFYEQMKLRQMESLGDSIVEQYGSAGFEEYVNESAFQNGVIIQLLDENGNELLSTNLFGGRPPNKRDLNLIKNF